MNALKLLLVVFAIPLVSIGKVVPPSQGVNVFSTFQVGKYLKKLPRFLQAKPTKLQDGGIARTFHYDFTALGEAVVHQGAVVTYNDTIRVLMLKLDQENNQKLWDAMVALYGEPGSTTILDNFEWIIKNTSFSMYPADGGYQAYYRDVQFFQNHRYKASILPDLDMNH